MMRFLCRTGFNDQTGRSTQSFRDKILMNGRCCQKRGDGKLVRPDQAIGNNQDIMAGFHGIDRFRTQGSQMGFDTDFPPRNRITDIQLIRTEFAVCIGVDIPDTRHFGKSQNRLCHFQPHRWIHVIRIQQVRLRPDIRQQRHDDFFPDRIDRRVRHLCKRLAEIVIQGF